MTCAVSCCVCIASIVKTAPARSVNAFSSSPAPRGSHSISRPRRPGRGPCRSRAPAPRPGQLLPVLFLAPRTVLPSMAIARQPPACTARVHSQAREPVQHVGTDQGERAAERGLLRRPAHRAQHGQDVRAGVGGPLPDRGERPRARDHRRDPDGKQPGQQIGARASSAGPGPGQGDQEGSGSGQPG